MPAEEVPVNIEISEKAHEELVKALDGKDLTEVGLRVSVYPGGCSGFQYGLAFEDAPAENDVIVESKGVRVFVEKDTGPLLDGIQIDFVDTLMGGGFKINNPNATSSCGCGKSFS